MGQKPTKSKSVAILGALALVAGCVGRIGRPLGGGNDDQPAGAGTTAGGSGSGGSTGGPSGPCVSAAARRVRRLSQREYFNVVGDLLGAPLAALGKTMLPLEPPIAGFDNQD